jgi:hypothetical protein
MSARVVLAHHHERRLDAAGWALLGLALLIIALGVAQTLYRLALPTEGWSFVRDASGGGQRMIFEQNLANTPSPLASGDLLVAVEGQPVERILAHALTLQSQPPANWAIGRTARYTILRDGREISLDVRLVRLPITVVISTIARQYLAHPVLLLALLIGLFVFLWTPRAGAARLLFLICTCLFTSEGISQAVGDTNVFGPAVLFDRVYWPAQFFNSLIWPFVVAPLFLHLFLSFPSVQRPLHSQPRPALALLYGFTPVLTLLAVGLNWGRPLDAWRAWSSFSVFDYFVTLIGVILSMAYTLATVRDPAGRAQIRWLAWGAVVTCAGALVGGVLGVLGQLGERPLLDFAAYRLPLLAFPIALAIAITRYRLFEIDIIINRTLVYGVLTAVLALVYGGSVVVLQTLVHPLTGEERSQLVTVASTLLIAALFTPLRRRIQATIDRRFYRRKYDAARTLAAFGVRMRDEVDLGKLTDELRAVVEQTVQPEHLSLWLRGSQVAPGRSTPRVPPEPPADPHGSQ